MQVGNKETSFLYAGHSTFWMVSKWNILYISKIPIGNKILKESFPLRNSGLPFNPAMEIFCRGTILPHVFLCFLYRQLACSKLFFWVICLLSFGRYHATFTYIPTFDIKIHFNSSPTYSKFLIWNSYSDTYKSALAHANDQVRPSSSVYIYLSNSLHQNHAFILWASIYI